MSKSAHILESDKQANHLCLPFAMFFQKFIKGANSTFENIVTILNYS